MDFALGKPDVHATAAKCNYGDQLQMQLIDRLIADINVPELKLKLFLLVIKHSRMYVMYISNAKVCCMIHLQKMQFSLILPQI